MMWGGSAVGLDCDSVAEFDQHLSDTSSIGKRKIHPAITGNDVQADLSGPWIRIQGACPGYEAYLDGNGFIQVDES